MIRTQDEIVAHMNKIKEDDMFGFQTGDLIGFLDFEHARPFLKDMVTKEYWDLIGKPADPEVQILDYLPFAWEKANNCRGLSASRSISHFLAWIWLIDDNFYKEIYKEEDENYQYYGKDILVMISEKYKFDYKKVDDGIRSNEEY